MVVLTGCVAPDSESRESRNTVVKLKVVQHVAVPATDEAVRQMVDLNIARLQAYAYLGDNRSASKAVEKAKRSGEPDAAMDKLENLLQERLQLSS